MESYYNIKAQNLFAIDNWQGIYLIENRLERGVLEWVFQDHQEKGIMEINIKVATIIKEKDF